MRPQRSLWLPRPRRWSIWAVALSVAAHALLFLFKIGAYTPPGRLPPAQIYLLPKGAEGQRAFDMQYQIPGGAARKGRAAGITPRPEQEQVQAPEPVVPQPAAPEAPVVVAQPPAPPPAEPADSGTGPGRRRIGPAMGEGKLWVHPLPAPPREIAQTLTQSHYELVDSAVSAIVQQYIDSVLNAPSKPGAALPSWTTQLFGKTFGLDSKYIYLGGLKIPAAVLALLPIKSGGATMEYSQANRLALIREDLQRASARAQTLDDFKRAIRELRAERERLKELERNQKLKPEKKDSSKSP
ncbi:MAG TPA: hypothetical protein VFU23_12570 [Gemmatimonadales bacterium]|nr:hypothetical protein [Gemmatimonadales bacterium]